VLKSIKILIHYAITTVSDMDINVGTQPSNNPASFDDNQFSRCNLSLINLVVGVGKG
jgi:hypothetical protein